MSATWPIPAFPKRLCLDDVLDDALEARAPHRPVRPNALSGDAELGVMVCPVNADSFGSSDRNGSTVGSDVAYAVLEEVRRGLVVVAVAPNWQRRLPTCWMMRSSGVCERTPQSSW